MNENRRKILEMLAQGQITADEAERLIAALEQQPESRPKPKYIRVVIANDRSDDKTTTANIRVPMQLLRAGVKLSSFMPSPVREHVNDFLRNTQAENIEELIDQLGELTVDVNEKDVKVRIFCE
jgi:hypothetical protein